MAQTYDARRVPLRVRPECPFEYYNGIKCRNTCVPITSAPGTLFLPACAQHITTILALSDDEFYYKFSPICTFCKSSEFRGGEAGHSVQKCKRYHTHTGTTRYIWPACPQHGALALSLAKAGPSLPATPQELALQPII